MSVDFGAENAWATEANRRCSADAAFFSADDADEDFGDFEEGEGASLSEAAPPAPISASLPLSNDPQDPAMRQALSEQMPRDFTDVNADVPGGVQANVVVEGMREVEGLTQVLVSEQSRSIFCKLSTNMIAGTPLDWRRSHTRRQYLISLGVPINLDEVHGNGRTKEALPPLELHVKQPHSLASTDIGQAGSAGTSERWGDRRRREIGLTQPSLPERRIESILQLTEDDIKLQTLPELRELAREMESLSKRMVDALQYHLQIREAFTSDGESFHSTIRELVTGASNKIAARAKQEKRSGFMSRTSRPNTPAPK